MKLSDHHVRLLTGYGDPKAASVLTDEERRRCVVIADATERDMPIIFVSDQFMAQTGFPEDEVIGRNCKFLQGPETDTAAVQAIRDALADGSPLTVDILNYRKDGSEFWNRLRLKPVKDSDGAVSYYVGFQNPIPRDEVRSEPIRDFVD